MKPKIYKVGNIWVVWIPGVRVYRFNSWQSAVDYVLASAVAAREPAPLVMRAANGY